MYQTESDERYPAPGLGLPEDRSVPGHEGVVMSEGTGRVICVIQQRMFPPVGSTSPVTLGTTLHLP